MGSFERPSASISEPLDLYLHGYVSSRIMNLSRSATDSSSSPNPETEAKGLPVCITAAKLDGLVLTLSPNSHNYNYRSAMLFGYAVPVTDVEEKLWAMELITNSVVPDRWRHTRVPPNAAEMSSTQILRVRIDSGSAKVREGVPNDEKHDLDNPSVTGAVWTGVVPVWEEFGDPIAGPYNEIKEVPRHVMSYVEDVRNENKEYAERAARKDAPVKRKEPGEEE
ncbi:hypothetical protein B7463_g1086, partial [Scytalidium lignicola]